MTSGLPVTSIFAVAGYSTQMLISNELPWAAPKNALCINLTEDADLRYWTQCLACSPHELLDAVQAVGISVTDLSAHLKRHSVSAASR